MSRIFRGSVVPALLGVLILQACANRTDAPVIDRLPESGVAAIPAASRQPAVRAVDTLADTYTVKRGDTLYSIALDHGQDYREIAQWNGIENPNLIRSGQVLRVRPPEEGAVQVRPIAASGAPESRPVPAQAQPAPPPKPLPPGTAAVRTEPRAVKLPYTEENLALLSRDPKPAAVAPKPAESRPVGELKPATTLKPPAELKPPVDALKPAAEPPKPAAEPPKPPAPAQQQAKPESDEEEPVDWGWPTAGKLLAGYTEGGNKGLDITGKSGQPVLASATGKVLYVGSMRGYGKLLVIRHNKAYSTVYAHNDNVLVKEGQQVVKGQKVAEMGNSDTDQVKLHFEIRRFGKPQDPGKFLPGR